MPNKFIRSRKADPYAEARDNLEADCLEASLAAEALYTNEGPFGALTASLNALEQLTDEDTLRMVNEDWDAVSNAIMDLNRSLRDMSSHVSDLPRTSSKVGAMNDSIRRRRR